MFLRSASTRESRFSKDDLEELRRVFKKASTRQKMQVNEDGKVVERMVEVMNKEQFRSQMGLLGQQQHPYLADRIFEVFDTDCDGRINVQSFTSIMDVLCNGEEDERNMFGFALMDKEGNGEVTFEEFYDYFSQVISHWSSLVNSHVRISRAELLQIFRTIDIDNDGSVRYTEYRRALRKNPELLDWFDLLNTQKAKPLDDSSIANKNPIKELIEEKKR